MSTRGCAKRAAGDGRGDLAGAGRLEAARPGPCRHAGARGRDAAGRRPGRGLHRVPRATMRRCAAGLPRSIMHRPRPASRPSTRCSRCSTARAARRSPVTRFSTPTARFYLRGLIAKPDGSRTDRHRTARRGGRRRSDGPRCRPRTEAPRRPGLPLDLMHSAPPLLDVRRMHPCPAIASWIRCAACGHLLARAPAKRRRSPAARR